ncbi:MAG: PstS family phosphate ABC transporter substrate-binding protein [Chloroflexota bacterium]|nr:PstS family phosphate ABC transporter substrate-binding protein [Lentimicrobium sp.]
MKNNGEMLKPLLAIVFILPMFIFINSCSNREDKSVKNADGTIKGTISISGAFALYPMAVLWAEEFKKLNPEVRIDISAGGAGKGMTDALSQMVDLGMFSREVSQEEQAKGAWFIAVAKDAVVATYNPAGSAAQLIKQKGLNKEQLKEIYLDQKIRTWGELYKTTDKTRLNAYTRSDACGAAEMWGKFLGSNQESLKGVGVFGDPGIADAVKNDKTGLGYNNINYAYDMNTRKPYAGLAVVPIDLNNDGVITSEENFYDSLDDIMDAIATGKYPSPPSRDLYFVSKGKPKNIAVLAFLEWIVTDGQKFVHKAGYVNLTEEKVKNQLQKLSE